VCFYRGGATGGGGRDGRSSRRYFVCHCLFVCLLVVLLFVQLFLFERGWKLNDCVVDCDVFNDFPEAVQEVEAVQGTSMCMKFV